MDIIGPLPKTQNGNIYILVCTDYTTKYPEAFPLRDQKAETIAQVLFEEIICRYGTPRKILTDQGKNFMSEKLKALSELLGVKQIRTSPYHPQTDGLTERFNRTLIGMLSCYVNQHQTDWDNYIKPCLFAYRMAKHPATNETPFKLMFGRECNIPVDITEHPIARYMDDKDYVTEMKERLPEIWRWANLNVKFHQESFKELHDRKIKPATFKIGERILVNTPDITPGTVSKLKLPGKGPYEIIDVLGDTNLKIRLCSNPLKKPIIVHVNRCKYAAKEDRPEQKIQTSEEPTPKAQRQNEIKQTLDKYHLRPRQVFMMKNSQLDQYQIRKNVQQRRVLGWK